MANILTLEKDIATWIMTVTGIDNCMWFHRMGQVSDKYILLTWDQESTLANLRNSKFTNNVNTQDNILFSEISAKVSIFGTGAFSDLTNAKASLGSIKWSDYFDSKDCPVLRCSKVKPLVTFPLHEYLEQSEMVIYFNTNIFWEDPQDVGYIENVSLEVEILQTENDNQENIILNIDTTP